MNQRVLGVLLAAGMLACGAEESGEPQATRNDFLTESAAPGATLRFGSDWSEAATSALVAGGRVAIDYDEARLPNCRASHNGNPGWQIDAYVMFQPSGVVSEQGLFAHAQTATGPNYYSWIKTVPEFDIPEGTTEVQAWFKNGSGFDHPCTEWDSNYGQNYRFPVGTASSFAAMLFQSNWQNAISGNVARGGTLRIAYAPERMKTLVSSATLDGMPFFASKYHCYGYGCCSYGYDNRVHVRFQPWGDFTSLPIGDLPVELAIPDDATRVEVYFDTAVTTTTWYCGSEGPKNAQGPDQFYDSNYGDNFVFTIP